MANETVGAINCPFCMGEAEVKKNVKDKFYIWCSDDGIIQPTKPNFQRYIKENGKFFDGDGGSEAKPEKQEEIPEENEPKLQDEETAIQEATEIETDEWAGW